MTEVFFKKPNIAELKKKGYLCIDMHVHTEFSPDSKSKAKDIIKRAEQLGIGIGIADHNQIKGAVKVCSSKKAIFIPGIEVNSTEGLDILFYFANLKDLKEFYKKTVEPNKKKTGLEIRCFLQLNF